MLLTNSPPPTRVPFNPASSINRPEKSPGGFLNILPRLAPAGWEDWSFFCYGRNLPFYQLRGAFFHLKSCTQDNRWFFTGFDDTGPVVICKIDPPTIPIAESCPLMDARYLPFPELSATFEPNAPALLTTAPPTVPGIPEAHSKPLHPLEPALRAKLPKLLQILPLIVGDVPLPHSEVNLLSFIDQNHFPNSCIADQRIRSSTQKDKGIPSLPTRTEYDVPDPSAKFPHTRKSARSAYFITE